MRKDLVDDDAGDIGRRVVGPWGSANIGTGTPVGGIIRVATGVRIARDEREAIAVRSNRPWARIAIGKGEDGGAERMTEGDFLSVIIQAAGVITVDDQT